MSASPRWPRRRPEPDEVQILRAAREELRAAGYERTTLAAVALRAGVRPTTVHRRWWSRAELVIDALAGDPPAPTAGALPDTGRLADDLRALWARAGDEVLWQALPRLVADVADAPELSDTIRDRIVRPRVDVLHALLRRAADRGELDPATDLELLAGVPAAMVTYRLLVTREPVDAAYVAAVCERLLVAVPAGVTVTP